MNKIGEIKAPRWLDKIYKIASRWGDGTRSDGSDRKDRLVMTSIVVTLKQGLALSEAQKRALLSSMEKRLCETIEWDGDIRLTK